VRRLSADNSGHPESLYKPLSGSSPRVFGRRCSQNLPRRVESFRELLAMPGPSIHVGVTPLNSRPESERLTTPGWEYHRRMLKRLLVWIKARKSRPPTPEDLEAEREAKRFGEDAQTDRIEERQVTRVTGR
jgi:hypothetical protein